MAVFPNAISNLRALVNRAGAVYDVVKTKVFYAEDHNNIIDEVQAIETILGVNPEGAFTTVGLRIAGQEARTIPVKTTGAGINTGTNDTDFATPKAIADSNIAFLSDIPSVPIKTDGAGINTGTNDTDFATAAAIAASTLMKFSATRFVSGFFERDMAAASGTVDTTGLGFTPKAIIFIYIIPGTKVFGVSMVANNAYSFFNNGTSDVWDYYGNGFVLRVNTGVQQYTTTTLITDGFRNVWTKQGSPTGTAGLYFLAFR